MRKVKNNKQFDFFDILNAEVINGLPMDSNVTRTQFRSVSGENMESLDDKQSLRDGSNNGQFSNTYSNKQSSKYSREERNSSIRTQHEPSGISTNSGNQLNTKYNNFFREKPYEQSNLRQNNHKLQKYQLTHDSFELSNKTNIQNSINAITTLVKLEQNELEQNIKNLDILATYEGFGSTPVFFNSNDETWKNNREILQTKLSSQEYNELLESTADSFYTPNYLIKSVFNIIDNLGYLKKKELTILEPSLGSGKFIGIAPLDFRENNKFIGIEKDNIAYLIAKHLYHDTENSIIHNSYQKTIFNNQKVDIVIGNFPFGNQNIYDASSSFASSNNLHNYFLCKSLELLQDKGILVAITSNNFLNKHTNLHKEIDKIADFKGTIRLPKETFKSTNALCDIVIFQKNDEKALTKNIDNNVSNSWYNHDFDNYQESLADDFFVTNIGEKKQETNQFNKPIITLSKNSNLIPQELNNIINNNIINIENNYIAYNLKKVEPNIKEYKLDNSILVGEMIILEDNTIAKRVANNLKGSRVEILSLNSTNIQKYTDFLTLKESLKYLLQLEMQSNSNISLLYEVRKELNSHYTNFVDKWGNLHDSSNKSIINKDIKGRLVLNLEKKSKDNTYILSDIFTNRLINYQQLNIQNLKDAIHYSQGQKGFIDIKFIANLAELNLKGNEIEVINSIITQNLAYLNPTSNNWELKEHYLSGNIKEKLDVLNNLTQEEQKPFSRNIIALKNIYPKLITIDDIDFELQSNWIPIEVKHKFILDLLGRDEKIINHFSYHDFDNTYDLRIHSFLIPDAINTIEYGTELFPASDILISIFHNTKIAVYDKNIDGEKIFNKVETTLAQEKETLIKAKFVEYILQNLEIAKQVEQNYNDKFNTFIPCKYNGKYLNLPNTNSSIVLRDYQKGSIIRGIIENKYLLDHYVGAGKTFTMIATIMERKRLKLDNKAILVVPKHLISQWRDSFYELYPNANILVANEKNFNKQVRSDFLSIATLNNWDCIITSHSNFLEIPLSNKYIQREIDKELENISNIEKENKSTKSIKNLKKIKDGYLSKIDKLTDNKTTELINFENMGIDSIFVDEAHEFKNLQFATSHTNIPGINPNGSKKAYDLFLKCRYIQIKKEGGVFLATGTPLSNSLAESYTLFKYLDYNILQDRNIAHFDAWCSTFANIENKWQVSSTGKGFVNKAMFSNFKNIQELAKLYSSFADCVTLDNIKNNVKIPLVKMNNILVEATSQQISYMKNIVDRMQKVSTKDPKIDNPLKITNDARLASCDMRLINPEQYFADNKINVLIENVANIYNLWQQDKGTQLVFCDIGTPNNQTFSIYHEMKNQLINKGISKEEIKFIHEAKTDEQKENLYNNVNNGNVRVLIGSSAKMGAGMNVQTKLVALHHFDAPWRPTDLEQREGRIIRQGNTLLDKYQDFTVTINRYATKNSYDSRVWQILENKAEFIAQFRKGNLKLRSIEDISNNEIKNAQEMKAITSGNPYFLLYLKLKDELHKKETIFNRNKKNIFKLKQEINDFDNNKHRKLLTLNKTLENLAIAKINPNFLIKKEQNFEILQEQFSKMKVIKSAPNSNLQTSTIARGKNSFPSLLQKELSNIQNEITLIHNNIKEAREVVNKPILTEELSKLKIDVQQCKQHLDNFEVEPKFFIPKSKFSKDIGSQEINTIKQYFNKNTITKNNNKSQER